MVREGLLYVHWYREKQILVTNIEGKMIYTLFHQYGALVSIERKYTPGFEAQSYL